jgi:DNA-binding NarL/FixJ family response regulator
MGRIRILLADDHTIARAGMKALLKDSNIDVVAEAADGPQALDRALALTPDVAVLDYDMPGLTGAEVAARLRQEAAAVKALVLSAHEDRAFLRQVLAAGAKGYVLKRAAAEELVQAITVVAAGGMYLDPTLTEHVVDGFVNPPAAAAGNGPGLTEREVQVLRLIARGYANKEVAAQLDVSVKTVENHKLRAMEKLGLNGRVDLVQYAYDHGWLTRQ